MLTRVAPEPIATHSFDTHPDQLFDVYQPPSPALLTSTPIVFIHGGYWRPEYDRMHARSAAAALAQAGWTTALIEYRRIPSDPDATVADVVSGITAVGFETGAEKVVLVGHSAGGHLALVAADALPDQIAGVLALAPVSDLLVAEALDLDDGAVRAFLGCPAERRADLDPGRTFGKSSPTRILHGTHDTLVPFEMSQRFGTHAGVPVHSIDGIGHYELIDPQSRVWPIVVDQLNELAPLPPT